MARLRVSSALLFSLVVGVWPLACANDPSSGLGGGSGGSGGEGGDTTSSTSSGGLCTSQADCEAFADACNEGTCINGSCGKTPKNDGASCDDGLYCTVSDLCVAGACKGSPRPCDVSSQNPCQTGVCDEASKTCVLGKGNDGAACIDGDLCTIDSTCQNGTCGGGQPVDCSFLGGVCGVPYCDPTEGCKATPQNDGVACDNGSSGECSYGLCEGGACKSIPINEGASCDDLDFNECTVGTCTNGICLSQGLPDGSDCDGFFFDPCTKGACQFNFCSPVPANDGDPCDDYLLCTENTVCQGGICQGGTPYQGCAPPGGCYIGSCDPMFDMCTAQPGNDGASCDAGDPCQTGTTCAGGACIGGTPANDGLACDDGLSCTTGETCSVGICQGGMGAVAYFKEDFSDNLAGWTLGNEWQIGPAIAGQTGFGDDPGADHTPTGDNGLAGVVIGGNASTVIHGYYYLESPTFDTSAAVGSVYFSYYRWLNSDYDPFMHNRVDVWDGTQWVNLFLTGMFPGVMDTSWTFMEHDVTAYKNAGMKVRFGFDIGSDGVYSIGSWNVDDVRVTSVTCP